MVSRFENSDAVFTKTLIGLKLLILTFLIKTIKKNKMKNWKTTLIGVALSALYLIQSAYKDANMDLANVHWFDVAISCALLFAGALQKDFDVTGAVKSVLIIFTMFFSNSVSAQAGSGGFSAIPAAGASGSVQISGLGGILCADTNIVYTDSTIKEVRTNPHSKETAGLEAQADSVYGTSYARVFALDSNAKGGVLNLGSGGRDGGAYLGFNYEGGGNNEVASDSLGITFDNYNTATETQEDGYTFPKRNLNVWADGSSPLSRVAQITSGEISTTSGSDTIFLTTTGTASGAQLYSSSTEYSVILSPPSSDSTVYSFKITKTNTYFVVLVRQSNTLFHFEPVSDATKVNYITVGEAKLD